MICALLMIGELPTAGLSFRNFCPVTQSVPRPIGSEHLPTVLIVDDHAAIRIAVRDIFESSFEPIVCGEAENGPMLY